MVDLPIVGDAGRVLADMIKAVGGEDRKLDQKALKAWWAKIDGWRGK